MGIGARDGLRERLSTDLRNAMKGQDRAWFRDNGHPDDAERLAVEAAIVREDADALHEY